jgi:putative salt-induced outer membrane protein YdiY
MKSLSELSSESPIRFIQRAFAGLFTVVSLLSVQNANADTVKITDNSVLTGEVKGASGGKIHLETLYSGPLKIDQTKVVSIVTTKKLNVRLASGSTLLGTIEAGAQPQEIVIRTDNGVITTTVADIQSVWSADAEDPSVTTLKTQQAAVTRKWAYSAGINLSGQQGNSDEFGLAANFSATLKGPQDQLKFYLSTLNNERNGVTSANETKGGVDYASVLKNKYGWYTRFELEKDEFEELDLRSTTAAGISYQVIKTDTKNLGLRAGFAYRHESYSNNDSFEDPALDLGLNYDQIVSDLFKFNTKITYIPDFSDFTENYRLTQDTGITIPVVKTGIWSIRLGFSNDYNSMPFAGKEELDTRYYLRLQFDWGS